MRPQAVFTGHKAAVYALAPGDRAGTFFSADGNGAVVRWQMDAPDQGEQVMQAGEAVFSLQVAPGHARLWVGTENGQVIVADLKAHRAITTLHPHTKGVFAFATLANERVACAGGDGTLSIQQQEPIAALRTIPLAEGKLRALALNADGSRLAVACNDGSAHVLETVLLNTMHAMQAHPTTAAPVTRHTGCTAIAFHPAKPVLFTGGKDGHLRAWRTDDAYRPLLEMPAHAGAIYRIAFSPDGKRFATASRDKTCMIWDANTLDPIVRLDRAAGGHSHSVNTALWLGDTLITAGDDRRIRAWCG